MYSPKDKLLLINKHEAICPLPRASRFADNALRFTVLRTETVFTPYNKD